MDFTINLSTPITALESPAARGNSAAIPEPLPPENGKSYVRGTTAPRLSRAPVWDLLERAARRSPGGDAAVFPAHGVRWSWHTLKKKAEDLAAGLLALGLEPGDRLGIWAPNRPEWLLTQFATARIGVVLVTINPAYRSAELEYALRKSGCKAVVLADRFKSSNYVEMLREVVPDLTTTDGGAMESAVLPALRHAVLMSDESLTGFMRFADVATFAGPAQHSRLKTMDARLDPDDAINIQFTSGTTGAPKGATLTHSNIVNNARFVVKTIGLGRDDRLCIPVPLYHCFGMVMGVLGATAVGAAMVFPGEAFDAPSTLDALVSERCTAVYGVPTMFVAMLENEGFDNRQLRSLRTGIMAGAPCPVELMRRVVAEMNMRDITIAYGMTETSPVSFQSHVTDPLERRVSTVGRVHPHVEVKIVDSRGRVVSLGEQGELCTRGYSVMLGYWDDDNRTAESIDRAGWMHTGDLATMDAQGYCAIVGRIKDMLIRGGENVYPREIEEFLSSHPGVEQAQVFGVPDERFGEEICAWVVARAGHSLNEDALADYCRGRIAHFKVPRYVRVVDEFPMTVTGKPQKFLMRAAMVDELGLND